MNKYMVLYVAPITAEDQMQSTSPEERQESMAQWMAWFKKHEAAVIEMGSPLGNGINVAKTGPSEPQSKVAGYTIVQAADLDSVQKMVSDHPHHMLPGGSIDVLEMIQM